MNRKLERRINVGLVGTDGKMWGNIDSAHCKWLPRIGETCVTDRGEFVVEEIRHNYMVNDYNFGDVVLILRETTSDG